ncbi:MAG: outer membrane beta-barrel protein [Alphaproteobacteria bacterium]|nr:outer membrane beta-barrel protein [Alphaproteobacteria bacterium]
MNLFKTALFAVICVVAASTSSLAAKGSAGGWGGAYAGLSAGYLQDSSALIDIDGNYSADNNADMADGIGNNLEFGGQAGYNWQDGRLVYGFEADAFGVTGESLLGYDSDEFDRALGQTIDTTASLRARLGVTVDNDYMIYGTGGVATLQTVSSHLDNSEYDGAQRHYLGWTAGLGAEKKINSSYSAKFEGRWSEFGAQKWTDGANEEFGADPQTFAISAGVNYHF